MTYRYEKMFDELMKSGGQYAVNSCKADIEYEQKTNRHDPSFTEAELKTGERTFLSLRMDSGSKDLMTKCFRGAAMVMQQQKLIREMAWVELQGEQYRNFRDETFAKSQPIEADEVIQKDVFPFRA